LNPTPNATRMANLKLLSQIRKVRMTQRTIEGKNDAVLLEKIRRLSNLAAGAWWRGCSFRGCG
jgi:hypothetical protein